MTDPVLSLIRPDLQGFAGYSSAAKEATGAPPAIKLDANENPWPPFGPIAALCDIHHYAAPQPPELLARMGEVWGVEPKNIYATCGSDQAIDMLLRLFCRAGVDELLVCPPTFVMYQVYAQVQGARPLFVPLKNDGQLDVDGILKTASDNTKLIFVPTPNAPMGHAMNKDDILALCKAREGKSLVIADEAYVEFSDDKQGFVPWLGKVPNLVILRTLSKAHALAGERLGCAIGPEALIDALAGVGPAYPLAQSAVRAALDALSPAGLALSRARCKILADERERLLAALPKAEGVVRVNPSKTNFLFVETTDAAAFLARLRAYGIAGRSMDGQRKGAVRLAVGAPEQNDILLTALGLEPAQRSAPARLFGAARATKETRLEASVNLDGPAGADVQTGLGFFDHMLAQLALHGGFALTLRARGDLEVDTHHLIEDTGLVLGEALRGALGDKAGLARYGFTAPMDEALARAALDLSGRPFLKFEAAPAAPASDGMGMDLVEHFFRSFAQSLGATLHLEISGENNHHRIEAAFKAVGRALRQALAREGDALPSTKGVL